MKYYLLTVLLNLFLPENTISCNRSVTNMMYYYVCRSKKNGLNQFFKEVFWLKWNFFLHLYIAACYKTIPIEVDHTYKNYLEFSVDIHSNQKKATITVLFLISSIFPTLRKYRTQKINAFNEKLFDTLMAINNCNT